MSNKVKLDKENRRVSYAKAVFGREEIDAVNRVLSTPMIVAGPKVKDFEEQIAKLFGKRFGVMTNSGSSANLIALEILDLPPGSEIITPILTFGTTVSPMLQKGITPIFVDVTPGTYQIDVDKIEELITLKTKALFIPSLIGNIPDYPRLRELADKHNLYLIEDSCDTLGAAIEGESTGKYSHISTTSFYASHVITAAGGGGMICFNDPAWHKKAKTLVGWGRSSATDESEDPSKRLNIMLDGLPYDRKFIFEEVGYNFQATDISAAFGLAQLEKFPGFFQKRQENFQKLLAFFSQYENFFILPKQNPNSQTAWLAFPLTIRTNAPFDRLNLVRYLEENNIQTRPIFTGNVLRQPAFKNIKDKTKDYHAADEVMERALLIGCHHGLEDEDIEYIKEVFTKFLHA